MTQYVLTGRLVQGDVYKMQPKKDNNNKTVLDAQGQPVMNYFVALAVPKGDPKWPAVKAGMDADAARFWPNGETRRADFASKVSDGDSTSVNKANKRNCDYDGFPGNWIVKLGTLYPPEIKYWDAHQGKWVLSPGGHVKIGDYVSVAFDVTSNKSTQTPGVHLNPKLIGLEREGEAIVSAGGVDAEAVLGSRGPGNGGAPAGGQSGGAATTQSSGTATGGSYSGYMDTPPPPGDDAPPPPGDDAPPPPSGPQMTDKAQGKSYESFTAKGWTEAQLRQHGYIV